MFPSFNVFQIGSFFFQPCCFRGSTIAKIAGENTADKPDLFEQEVRMWTFEEMVEGRKLTEIINQDHVNVKYLPDIQLPTNVVRFFLRDF